MGVRNPKPRIEGGWGGMRGGGGSRFRVPRFYYAPLKFYLATKKDTWEQHPANLIPPLTTKHASELSVYGTPSLARCRDILIFRRASGSSSCGAYASIGVLIWRCGGGACTSALDIIKYLT